MTRAGRLLHLVVPDWIDDPARPSGGNVYDRRVGAELTALGWTVQISRMPGSWPAPGPADLARLGEVLDDIADGAVVLVDGLIGSAAPSVLAQQARRLALVVLVHLPLGVGAVDAGAAPVAAVERTALSAVSAVISTSRWSRNWLLDRYGLDPQRVHVAAPGVDAAEVTTPSPAGGRLLCVAAVTRIKGHDVLLDALAGVDDVAWQLRCVGSMSAEPGFAAQERERLDTAGLTDRVQWSGPLTGPQVSAAYAEADLLLVPSRLETYGLVVTEALARGLPVLGSAAGGVPESLGTADGTIPGLLVPPGDPVALRTAIRRWLTDPVLRGDLRAAARVRRSWLRRWTATATDVAGVLTAATPRAATPGNPPGFGTAPEDTAPENTAPDTARAVAR